MARYTVLLYEEEGVYAVLTPYLGIATQGSTIPEAPAMAKEAAELHIRGLADDGEPVLEEQSVPIVAAIDVEVPVEVPA
jgi:predicted RNase H-like HicB family nuclease